MHPDLSPHLHTDECNELIRQLKECQQTNRFKRFLGVCSDIDHQVYKCLMRERDANRKANAEKAKIRQERMRVVVPRKSE